MNSLSDPRGVRSDTALEGTMAPRHGWLDVALRLTEAAGSVVADALAARRARRADAGPPVICSLAINRPPHEIYAFVRRLSQLPLFIDYLHDVREADSKYSHWVAKLPGGGTLAWDVKITEDRPGELIAWQSVQGSLIDVRGRASFAPTPRRGVTEVRLEAHLLSIGRPSRSVAPLFSAQQVSADLARLEQLLATADPHGDSVLHRAASPPIAKRSAVR
jgi:uncharacterized membrane protein